MTPQEVTARLSVPWQHGAHVDLRGITCEGVLDLSGRVLPGVDFSGATFEGGLLAAGARFAGLCWFGGAHFAGPARFEGATFLNDARFERGQFDGAARFDGAEFRGIGRFDHARFAAGASFAKAVCYGNFSLEGMTAAQPMAFDGCEWLGGLWCEGAELPAQTTLADTQVHGRLWLRNAHLGAAPLQASAFGMAFGYSYI